MSAKPASLTAASWIGPKVNERTGCGIRSRPAACAASKPASERRGFRPPFPPHLSDGHPEHFISQPPAAFPSQNQAKAGAHLDPGHSLSRRAAAEKAANPFFFSRTEMMG
ncbi:hypothetical protein M441DRAFT_374178 [Trichoderma asperellum CBS 433.97]|uniref:Uncharacterized protein n=1 Tax=Trichoderma asperellum (strain ATCC 204424 / CBS 433.97 / NBRC 101777) TaxID=1042311 RepID=A0A2T3ZFC5_TRIA4|nr:hypothetical protein M441DRAFT_374178 [Trichoderma asperellum CBS 433.97]PTB43518.1 hypothetical protein M441DRAFT_374178 [Trichoderma asperellum CBS 433.97]